MALPEPQATQHHSALVGALLVELREYGVQALAGIVATLCEDDGNPAVRQHGDAFRAIENAAGDEDKSWRKE